MFVVAAGLSALPTILLTRLGPVGVPTALAVTTLFVVLGSGRFVPAMTLVTNAVAPVARGAFLSFNTAVQSAAMAGASLLAGAMLRTGADGRLVGFDRVGWVSTAFVVLAMMLALRVRPAEEAEGTVPVAPG